MERGKRIVPRALITGITGFVGPWLADWLRACGYECTGIARGRPDPAHPIPLDPFHIHQVDIRDRDELRRLVRDDKPDFIFHLAALTPVPTGWAFPELAFEMNVGGTENLLSAVREVSHPVRLVIVSSGDVYGQVRPGVSRLSEDAPLHPSSPYASSKLVVERLVHDYVENWKLQAMIVRPFDHTGPGQSELCPYSQFASGIAAGVVSGNSVFLEAGDLKPLRDVSDVRDVIRGYALVAEKGKPGEIWNVCSGKGISLAEVVRELAEMSGVEVTIKGDAPSPWPEDPLRAIGDASRIYRDLGWKAEIPVRTTLRELLEYWIRRHQTLRK